MWSSILMEVVMETPDREVGLRYLSMARTAGN